MDQYVIYIFLNKQMKTIPKIQQQSQPKERQPVPLQISIQTNLVQWYLNVFKNKSQYKRTPHYVPQYKQSHPYRLVINKMQGLTSTKKNANSQVYLRIGGYFCTDKYDIIGVPFHYQCQYAMNKGDTRWEMPIPFYFHSKIDKNQEGVFIIMKVTALQLKNNFLQSSVQIGTIIISHPFIEQSNKIISIHKDLNQIQFGYLSTQARNKLLASNSTMTVDYTLQSLLQLKKLLKLIPENVIFTYQNSISGIHNNFLPRQIEDINIKDANHAQVAVNYLQIHISDKFQQDFIGYIKRIYPNEKSYDIKNRKTTVGFHNEYVLVSPISRKLQKIDQEIIGQTKIYIYEALKHQEVIKIPFYYEKDTNCCGIIVLGLIYQILGRQLQLACFFIKPINKGEEISQKMMIGGGYGSTYQLLPFQTNEKPTLIMEYDCNFNELSQKKQDEYISTSKLPQKGYIDEQILQKQRQKLKEEIQKQKLQILKQKEEMSKLKSQNNMQYQLQFEKKFQIQKQNLYKRQQMLENQYKQQVQREIREKFQLQEQIKKMNQKLRIIQQGQLKKNSNQMSHDEYYNNISSPKQSAHGQNQNYPVMRQRIDPSYVIQPENPIPVKKVREIIQKTNKNSSQVVKKSEEAFNYASRFTFTFTSIIWENNIQTPKSIYLKIRFFNQPQLRSEDLGYIEIFQGGYHKLTKISHFNQGFQAKEPSYSFLIDPSAYHQPSLLQRDLTQYLLNNNAIIDIFCGQNHLYIGQLNIKLKQILRGAKEQTLIAKELNIVKIKTKQVLGIMQILIKNEQVNCKDEISLHFEKKVKDIKKKIVSNAPININEQKAQLNNKLGLENQVTSLKSRNNNLNRQELRIQKFKQQKSVNQFAKTANKFNELAQTEKGVVLDQIHYYKEKKMQDYLKGVYQGLLNEKIILSAHFGKAVTFPFLFTNTSQSPSSYKITVLVVGSHDNSELTVIKNNKQWRYLTNKHKYIEPKRYDMIGQNNNFYLHAGQSVNLIFKFLSFQDGGGNSLQNKERIMNVTICKEDSNWIAGGFSLLVNMHEQIIHHSYILYEPGQQIVDLIVPVIYSQTQNTSTYKKLHLTDQSNNSTAQWLNPYQILVRIQTPKIMEKLKFNLLLYEDEYFNELTENWLIQIHAYEGVCTTYRKDYNTRFKIALPWDVVPAYLGMLSLEKIAGALQLFSSSLQIMFKNDFIELQSDRREQGSYEIWCQLISSENIAKCFEITCVSGDQGQLIYGWVVTAYPYKPRT